MSQNEELLFVLKMRDEASAVLKQNAASARSAASGYDELTSKLGPFRQALNQAVGGAVAFNGAIRTVVGSVVGMGLPIAGSIISVNSISGAFQVATDVLRQMVDATVAQERAQGALNNAIAVTRFGMGKGEVSSFLKEASARYLVDITSLTEASAELIRTSRITDSGFKQSMEMSVRLSKVMGTDVPGAARVLSGALADPVQGMAALGRAGVVLSETEKDNIRTMELFGGATKAQAELLEVLEDRLGGNGPGGAQSGLSGSIKGVEHAWKDLILTFQDSGGSKLLAGVIDAVALVIKTRKQAGDDIQRVQEQERQRRENVEFASLPERMAAVAARIAEQTNKYKELEKSEGPLAIAGDDEAAKRYKSITDEIKHQEGELEKLKNQYHAMGGVARSTWGMLLEAISPVQQAMKDMADDTDVFARKFGVVFDPGSLQMMTPAEKDAREKHEAAKARLEQNKKDMAEVDKEWFASSDPTHRQKLTDRRTGLINDSLKLQLVVQNTKETLEEISVREKNNKAIDRTNEKLGLTIAQQQRLTAQRQAEDDAIKARKLPGSPDYKDFVDTAMRRFDAEKALATANANAATSREAGAQLALADAYRISAREAHKLIAEQKAMENIANGSGPTDVTDLRNLEFLKGLVALSAETRKAIDELPDLEDRIARTQSSTAAFAYDAYAAVGAKIRELRSKMLDDGSPVALAQAAKLDRAEKDARDAVRGRASAQLGQAQSDFIARSKDDIETARTKIKVAGESQLVEEQALARLDAERERRKAIVLLAGDEVGLKQRLAEIGQREDVALQLAQVNEQARRAAGPLAAYQRDATEGWKMYESATVSALNATDEALTAILFRTKDWQTAMSDVLRSVVQDFARIAIHQNITAPLAGAVFGGGSAGGGSGLLGRAFGWLSSLLPFAGGGIMTERGALPLRRYASGGIARSPQLALFGEGSTPEAYVPVPNGRIPVTLRGGFGSGHTIATNIEVNVQGGGGSGAGLGGGDPAAMASQIGALVTAAFNRNLTEQMRPGGILNPAGAYNPSKVM